MFAKSVRVVVLGCALTATSISIAQNLQSELFITGLTSPVLMLQDPTDPNIRFVVQQGGRIRVLQTVGATTSILVTDFLNVSSTGLNLIITGSERGLLGMTFAPDYATAPNTAKYFYLNFTEIGTGTTKIVRFRRDTVNPLIADTASLLDIIRIAQPFSNHNGGTIRIGPDNMLYVGMGDGGSANDPGNRGQTVTAMLLGKMLRVDPTGDDFPADPQKNYRIPATNPFVGIAGDDEIWSLGVRNPWKWCFDRADWLGTNAMVMADVGQNAAEEVNYEPFNKPGRNYGWRQWEGNNATGLGGAVGPGTITFPFTTYTHASMGGTASITGGYVYRGLALGDGFFGRYFYSDYLAGRTYSVGLNINAVTGEATAGTTSEHTADLANIAAIGTISSIDVDGGGELYVVAYGGARIYKIVPKNLVWLLPTSQIVGDPFGSGQLRSLIAEDGKNLRLSQPLSFESSILTPYLDLNYKTDQMATTLLRVRIRASRDLPYDGRLIVALRNWSTGNFITVGRVKLRPSMTTVEFPNIPIASYRQAVTGRIDLRLFFEDSGPIGFPDGSTFFDHIKLTASN